MEMTDTAAPHPICGQMYDSMHTAQKPNKQSQVVKLNEESSMRTPWRRDDFLRMMFWGTKKDQRQ